MKIANTLMVLICLFLSSCSASLPGKKLSIDHCAPGDVDCVVDTVSENRFNICEKEDMHGFMEGYEPNDPRKLIEEGKLTIRQMNPVVYGTMIAAFVCTRFVSPIPLALPLNGWTDIYPMNGGGIHSAEIVYAPSFNPNETILHELEHVVGCYGGSAHLSSRPGYTNFQKEKILEAGCRRWIETPFYQQEEGRLRKADWSDVYLNLSLEIEEAVTEEEKEKMWSEGEKG